MIWSEERLICSASLIPLCGKLRMMLASSAPLRWRRVVTEVARDAGPGFIESLTDDLQCLGAVGRAFYELFRFHRSRCSLV